MRITVIPVYALLCILPRLGCAYAQVPSRQLISGNQADTWPATDALGRQLTMNGQNGTIRNNKFVGIFYFVWHGAHGYDQEAGKRTTGNILPKLPSDTVSPYTITSLLKDNPEHPH